MSDICYDTIIIGSGAGGLSAATALSNHGLSVLVLEAMPDLGGYLNPFKLDKYTFDGGMHYLGQLGEQGVFSALLERLGVWDRVRFNQVNPDGFLRFVCGDFEFHFPAGKECIKDRLKVKFPDNSRAIDDFFESILKIDRAVELAALIDTGRTQMVKALPQLPFLLFVLGKTYEDLVASFTGDAGLRKVLYAMNGGLPPNQVSALIPALMFRHYLDGAWYPGGGSGALRDALVKRIRENGSDFLNRTRILGVQRSGDKFVVKSDTDHWLARCVVCNADPTLFYSDILDKSLVNKKTLQQARNSIPSLSAFYAYIGTDLDLPSLGLNSATIQHNDSAESMESPVTDLTFSHFLISSTTLKDPEGKHAPPGKHIIEIVAQAPFQPFEKWAGFPSRKRGDEYKQFKQELGWNLIRKAERYIPGLSSHIQYVNFATPVTNHYWVNAPGGGCYGPAHLPSQVGLKRFSIKSNVPGLYLCGHGTMAGGVYPSMRSGEIAATHVVNYIG